MGRSSLNEQIKSKWNRHQREGADFKIMFGLFFVFAAFQAIIVVNASLFGEFSSKLAELDSGFSRGGPTFGLLQDYEDLLTDVIGSSLQLQHENATLSEDEQKLLLPKIYYKKGLIDLFLGKESKAIEDFRNCLVHDESMNIAKSRLFKLYLAHGRYKDIAELKESQYTVPKYKAFMESNVEVQQLMKDAEAVQRKIQEAELLVKQKNYAECINSVSSALGISPSNAQLYKTRIACTIKAALHNQKQKPTAGEAGQNVPETSLRQDLASYLIPDYLSLELLTPLVVENYITAASLYLFGLDEYENGAKHIRKGLHYDMDDAELKKFTLFFKRNEKLLKLLKRFKNLNSWLFGKEEIANEHVDINYLQKTDYEQLLELLFNTKPTIPARDVRKHYGGKEFANNYEYFTHLATEFNNKLFNTHESGWKAKLGFSTNTAPKHLLINGFTLDLDKFACESYLALKQTKQAKPYCVRVLETEKQNKDIENNYISSFLPAMVFDIQQFLKNKDLDKLREIYEMFHNNQNLQHFDLFKKLYSKIEKLLSQQQQQDQQQRFYQQQQHQQQRQYQQRPRQSAPKNDYYKTLGLAKDADERDIKKAYRNLVKKYHPDKYKGEDAEDKMAKINTAYEVLSNPELRARYDQGDDPNDQTGGGNQGGFGNAGGAAFNPFGNGQFHFDFGGAGSQFGGFDFGGFGGGPRKAKTGRKKSKRGH